MKKQLCPCGQPLHYLSVKSRRAVEKLVKELGPNVIVTTPFGSWDVPRHYIALHGLAAQDLPTLAKTYGWKKVAT